MILMFISFIHKDLIFLYIEPLNFLCFILVILFFNYKVLFFLIKILNFLCSNKIHFLSYISYYLYYKILNLCLYL